MQTTEILKELRTLVTWFMLHLEIKVNLVIWKVCAYDKIELSNASSLSCVMIKLISD